MEDTDRNVLLEQYKAYMGLADSTIKAKANTNRFFLTIVTGLFTLLALTVRADLTDYTRYLGNAMVSLIGIFFCFLWLASIRSISKIYTTRVDLAY